MSYKITLKEPSQLKFVCGLAIPSGYSHVMDMTFKNEQQLRNLRAAKGLAAVDIVETSLPPGAYDKDDNPVDYRSLHDWCMTNGEKPIRPVSSARKEESEDTSTIDDLKRQLDEKGVKYRSNASKRALEGLLVSA